MKKLRGRPREFDPQLALEKAIPVFWKKGLSATSLDDLSSAMEMNRPSIYNAFGNKEAIYRLALEQFCGKLNENIENVLLKTPDIKKALATFFEQIVDVYCATKPALGCLMICTAPAESFAHPEVKADLHNLISGVDDQLQRRIQKAIQNGELPESCDADLTAKLLQAVLHSLAIRARAGESSVSLKKFAKFSVQTSLRC
ncbi:MAG: AcrR family transcriptional regulator [Oceanicoccus sp.]|jgi:AcrR family transcriptional regulator